MVCSWLVYLRLGTARTVSGANMQPKIYKQGIGGLSVFNYGVFSLYSPKARTFANRAALIAGVGAVAYVGYVFIRENKR